MAQDRETPVLTCIHRKNILSVQQTMPNTKGRHVNERLAHRSLIDMKYM